MVRRKLLSGQGPRRSIHYSWYIHKSALRRPRVSLQNCNPLKSNGSNREEVCSREQLWFVSITHEKESSFPFISSTSPLVPDDVWVIILISCWDAGVKCARGSSLPDSPHRSSIWGVNVWLSRANGTRQTGCVLGTFRSPTHTYAHTAVAHPRGTPHHICNVISAGGKAFAGNQVYTKHKASIHSARSNTHQLSLVYLFWQLIPTQTQMSRYWLDAYLDWWGSV